MTYSISALDLQEPHIIQTGGLMGRDADSTRQAFDPKKISVRQALRQCAKKRTVATTKIDVQRRFAPKNLFQIEPIRQRIQRLRDQSRKDVPAVS